MYNKNVIKVILILILKLEGLKGGREGVGGGLLPQNLTFSMMSISSGLRSRSMDEMLSKLFLRTMPVTKGLAMIPGEAWRSDKQRNFKVRDIVWGSSEKWP